MSGVPQREFSLFFFVGYRNWNGVKMQCEHFQILQRLNVALPCERAVLASPWPCISAAKALAGHKPLKHVPGGIGSARSAMGVRKRDQNHQTECQARDRNNLAQPPPQEINRTCAVQAGSWLVHGCLVAGVDDHKLGEAATGPGKASHRRVDVPHRPVGDRKRLPASPIKPAGGRAIGDRK